MYNSAFVYNLRLYEGINSESHALFWLNDVSEVCGLFCITRMDYTSKIKINVLADI